MVQAGTLKSTSPPVALARGLAAMGTNDPKWHDMKRALLEQPSASLLHIAILDQNPREDRVDKFKGPHKRSIWRGAVQEEQQEGDEELEAIIEVSEDKQGYRALVLKFFPRYEDDADDCTWHRIAKRLRPFVDQLLRLGLDGLWGLRLDADILACPEVLGQLPLRHLELEVGQRSNARLSEIMLGLGQCSTLEYLSLQRPKTDRCSSDALGLPSLSLQKALRLKHLRLNAWFPQGNLCLPPGCQLRLDLGSYPDFWDQKWQSDNGKELMGCIPAMRLRFICGRPWPSNTRGFKNLQYLELLCPPDFPDLARLESIPHVRLDLHQQDIIHHTAGSWESLEIYRFGGFEIEFADIDAFVRENPKYLLKTFKVTKAWRNMSDALHAASNRQGVGCFPQKPSDGYYSKKLSSIKGDFKSWEEQHLVCDEQFWPKHSMQSCLASTSPCTKGLREPSQEALSDLDHESPSSLVGDIKALPTRNHRERAGQLTLLGRLTWLAHKLKPTRSCMLCGKCVAIVAPNEAA